MLWTISIVLIILWALGLVSSFTLSGYIHILLVIALIIIFDSHNSRSTNSLSQYKIQGRQVARDQRQSVQDGAWRIAEAAIHVAQESLPLLPLRHFFVTFPFQFRLWMRVL